MLIILSKTTVGAILALTLSFSVWADFTGKVVSVTDGDTVTVLDVYKAQHKIRLIGIDAPERRQSFGNRSKQSLSEIIFNKTVTVITNKRDRYGRVLGKVLINGVDVNREQIRRGMAWHYKVYQRDQSTDDRQIYADTEIKARDQRFGLWADLDPIPPWEWRKLRRQR